MSMQYFFSLVILSIFLNYQGALLVIESDTKSIFWNTMQYLA